MSGDSFTPGRRKCPVGSREGCRVAVNEAAKARAWECKQGGCSIRTRGLKALKVGHRVLVKKDDLESFLKTQHISVAHFAIACFRGCTSGSACQVVRHSR